MVEIVFSESACGSLKIAQTYGRGKYRGSAISVFIRHENGSVPSSNEMKEAQLQAQEQECIAWENAIPLGGKSSDVYCFDMALSVGDISDNEIGEQRKNVLKKMLSVWFVEDLDYQVEEKIQKIKTTLSSVIERYVAGEEVRIWYSYNPDELCGMYWLMKQLRPLNCQTTIYLVKLPTWEYGKENAMTSKISWGEVSPGEWGNYITLQEKAEPVFLSACAMKWNQLQNENAPLRAMLNGKLQSVSEDGDTKGRTEGLDEGWTEPGDFTGLKGSQRSPVLSPEKGAFHCGGLRSISGIFREISRRLPQSDEAKGSPKQSD